MNLVKKYNLHNFGDIISLLTSTSCLEFTKLYFFFETRVRVSNELGRGSAKSAKFSILVIVLTSLSIGIVLFVVFLSVRGKVAYIFTNNQEVVRAVAQLSPLLACSMLLNSVQPVLSGSFSLLCHAYALSDWMLSYIWCL